MENFILGHNIDDFMSQATRLAKFLDLYRSCNDRVQRNYVLHNAKQVLPEDDYMLLIDMAIDWIEALYQKALEKDRLIDEP